MGSSRTTAVDRLLLGFLAVLAVLAVAYVANPATVLAALGFMSAAVLVSAHLRGRLRWMEIVHAFVPVPILAMLVNVVGPIVQSVNPSRWDATLSGIDSRFFAPISAAWMHAGGRPGWLVDAASIAYLSHYLLPVAVGAVLWKAGRSADFDRFAFSVTLAFVALYAMYFAAPAEGPRIADAVAETKLGGGAVTAAVRTFLRICERNELDAFPSGHTAVTIVVFAECWSLFPLSRLPLVVAVGAIVFSTVYLSFHYVSDVVGGLMLALAIVAILPPLRALLGLASGTKPVMARSAASGGS